jgi:plasmid stabilization system protein ParE
MRNTVPKKTIRYHVKIQDQAIEELDKIYSFIFFDSPSFAKRFVGLLKKRILSLQYFPHRGSRIQLLETEGDENEIRFIEYQRHLIFYTVDKKDVIVLHITGPGQDWIRLFQ